MNQELQKYIQDARKAGASSTEIRKVLLDSGWPANDVDGALKSFQSGIIASISSVKRKSGVGKTLLSIGLISVVVAGFGIAAYLLFINDKMLAPNQLTSRQLAAVMQSSPQPTAASSPAVQETPTPTPTVLPAAVNQGGASGQPCQAPKTIANLTLDKLAQTPLGSESNWANVSGQMTMIQYTGPNKLVTVSITNYTEALPEDSPLRQTNIFPKGYDCSIAGVQGRCYAEPWDFSVPASANGNPDQVEGTIAFISSGGNQMVGVIQEVNTKSIPFVDGKPIEEPPKFPETESSLKPFIENLRCYVVPLAPVVQGTPTQTTPVNDATADWKKFVVTKGNEVISQNILEIKYPPDAELTDGMELNGYAWIKFSSKKEPRIDKTLTVQVANTSEENCRFEYMRVFFDNPVESTVTIHGVTFEKATWEEKGTQTTTLGQSYKAFGKKDYYCAVFDFRLKAPLTTTSEVLEAESKIFDQVMSTFNPLVF
ncbi:MAG: hypothetical protein PHI63_04410 [Patescibacteria group bacterium]|nr:hypothetical protein [Patescibacteria group bacterium]